MPYDEMTETTKTDVRPSSSSTTSSSTTVRLFDGFGGVEIGVRQAKRKAMVFVRVRDIVLAMWWKADTEPSAARPERTASRVPAASAPALPAAPSAPAGRGEAPPNLLRRLWHRFSAVLIGGR